ncbi:hypothetical protein ACIQXI_21665 [Lysinibacillus sp. NPDC097195]|uniref:hypothetical protein n=1 Tax=Lysinibacillus sp. NPDC097195 TaxID=3364141 RepID=UPI0037F9E1AD
MGLLQLDGFSNLVVSEEANETLEKFLASDLVTLDKIISKLLPFDEHGVHTPYFKVDYLEGKKYENIIEIKGKTTSRREWRILAVKISEGKRPATYALLHIFFKTTKKIRQQDKEKAYQIAISEGIRV